MCCEGPLHAAVNAMLAAPGDRMEAPVGRFEVAVCRGLRAWRLAFSTRSRDFTSEVWAERAVSGQLGRDYERRRRTLTDQWIDARP